ncbi:two-component system sensor histidine kinase NtrB [Fimbriiglobus ruber]|uniref:histidine kinase n=1 Tax=Fimbriiglobus ruber TaxID=1908690 RepID=A0A225D1Z5_9BACT|nr:ATP-binding protein [Fimbriiglobus ruber]OWK35601.1 Signal transduction histidine kinase [Fimbriiglobus ruber]
MGRRLAAHWQLILVVLLLAGSLVVLLLNSVAAFLLPQKELEARDNLRTAAIELAAAARPFLDEIPDDATVDRTLPAPLHRNLAAETERALAKFPGLEGGFYVNGRVDQFVGFAHPDGQTPPPGRRDPPPKETPSIRQQARESLTHAVSDPPLIEVRDIGPSRVGVATAAVGDVRPARIAAWVMVRLTGPDQQRRELVRYRISTILALVGILLALGLTANLARSLQRERTRREKLTDELRKAEHLAALGRLLAGVAHEVRNPLAAIRSTVQLWQRFPDQTRTPASLDAVVTAVDRINDLVGQLLQFARAGHEERLSVDLNAIVTETLELSRAQAERQGVRIEADLASDLEPVAGSAQALRQVALNLVNNALQVMPVGGRLVCRTRSFAEGVELTVADSGPGVPADIRDRLFEPFFTTRPDGTGLGLAVCREIVTRHGGRIELVTDVLVGATFRVILPGTTAMDSGGKS